MPEGEEKGGILQEYPQTFYTATRKEPFVDAPPLTGDHNVDVCVVGGGLAGIATALGVVERGKSVVVVERKRVGSEASGMNGGFAIPGFAVEGWDLVELVGKDKARTMFRWSMEAFEKMQQRIAKHAIQCDFDMCGQVSLSCFAGGEHEAREDATALNTLFGTRLEVWSRAKVQSLFFSRNYYHGVFDPDVASLHPLNFTLGLARIARSYGVRFFERTEAVDLTPAPAGSGRRWCVSTSSTQGKGSVCADDVVLAGGSSIGGVGGTVGRSLVPLLTFIMVTEPLPDQLAKAFTPRHCVVDDRFALNYYRVLPDGRLLWGGRAATFRPSPARLNDIMRADLTSVYPQLADVPITCTWGGPVSYAYHMMPLIGQRQPGLWHCTGFGGHGLVPTQLAGDLVAAAIAEGDTRYTLFSEAFPPRYVGWPASHILGTLAYWSYRAADWAALTRQRVLEALGRGSD
eukprot:m.4920 g.4920  ORF g.4920 m.4920 type:complete len:459 (-) comp4413_c0_seq1:21-1397(-)